MTTEGFWADESDPWTCANVQYVKVYVTLLHATDQGFALQLTAAVQLRTHAPGLAQGLCVVSEKRLVMKVLITGDVNGSLAALFKRVTTVNKSNGPFDMLFCVGCFFPIAGKLLVSFFAAYLSSFIANFESKCSCRRGEWHR